MRRCIHLGSFPRFKAEWLRNHERFLYRRVADQDRALLAVGIRQQLKEPLFDVNGAVHDWIFGFLAYGYKDRLEHLGSRCSDDFGWPESMWFIPRFVVEWSRGEARLHVHDGDDAAGMALVESWLKLRSSQIRPAALAWKEEVSRESYLEHVQHLLGHIHRGDIYELNFCMARTAHAPDFDPCTAFDRMLDHTDAPFAGLLRWGSRHALCMSPERFLAFRGRTAHGEPMKGTRPRGVGREEDERLRVELYRDAKERSENIMAVDVMRNDLARVSMPGSVSVTGLCEVRTYPRVHQMVSTIEATLEPDRNAFDAVRASFPMASMTGAPKISAMRLIDEHEPRARGLYSGTMGFFAPDGTADLNVIIRSLLFDAASGQLCILTGSALTAQCDPAAEWEECRVKFNSIADAI